jgi:hypothetical protein
MGPRVVPYHHRSDLIAIYANVISQLDFCMDGKQSSVFMLHNRPLGDDEVPELYPLLIASISQAIDRNHQ